jgi:MoxR-like ATPase
MNIEHQENTIPAETIGRTLADHIQNQLRTVVSGQESVIQGLLTCLVAGGHALLEGVPGVAKTLLVKCLAASADCKYSRIQLTPDLMPSDITGVNIYDQQENRFMFRKGPVFGDIVLADEINRAPAKTQAALLEAMQEKQVTIDGEQHALSELFIVVATRNPVDYEGVYPLPEAQLDRFLMKLHVPYPSEEAELEMLQRLHALGDDSHKPETKIQVVVRRSDLASIRSQARAISVEGPVMQYIINIIRRSRFQQNLSLGASPRAAVMLMEAAKALAILRAKEYVTPDEVQTLAYPVLRHRIRLTPEAEVEGLSPDNCIQELLQQVPIPR